MKRIIFIQNQKLSFINCVVCIMLMMACDEVEKGQYAIDNIPPGQVSNVIVENLQGGAVITYTVPDDEDLLYVKVVYQMSDGTQVEQKSSAYGSRIVVEGLGRAQKQTVQLICGDRNSNESAPYPVNIEPLDAPIYEIFKTIKLQEDYGGISLTWDNPLKANIVLNLYVLDEYNLFSEVENVYTATSEGKYSLRGFPTEEATFAVSLRDRWNNKTDMISGTFIPLFEEKLNRLLFTRWNPSGIPYQQYGSYPIENFWNGITTTEVGYSCDTTQTIPHSITFNLGQAAKLNRIKLWQRTNTNSAVTAYNIGNLKKFQLWGSPNPNVSADFDTWLFLGEFTSFKPSGLPIGQITDEDLAYAQAGEDYIIQENRDEPIQYIRIHILELWGGGTTTAQMAEIEFYGAILY